MSIYLTSSVPGLLSAQIKTLSEDGCTATVWAQWAHGTDTDAAWRQHSDEILDAAGLLPSADAGDDDDDGDGDGDEGDDDGFVTVKVDEENAAETWWNTVRFRDDAPPEIKGFLDGITPWSIRIPRAALPEILAWCEDQPGWAEGPEYAPHPLIVR